MRFPEEINPQQINWWLPSAGIGMRGWGRWERGMTGNGYGFLFEVREILKLIIVIDRWWHNSLNILKATEL